MQLTKLLNEITRRSAEVMWARHVLNYNNTCEDRLRLITEVKNDHLKLEKFCPYN